MVPCYELVCHKHSRLPGLNIIDIIPATARAADAARLTLPILPTVINVMPR